MFTSTIHTHKILKRTKCVLLATAAGAAVLLFSSLAPVASAEPSGGGSTTERSCIGLEMEAEIYQEAGWDRFGEGNVYSAASAWRESTRLTEQAERQGCSWATRRAPIQHQPVAPVGSPPPRLK